MRWMWWVAPLVIVVVYVLVWVESRRARRKRRELVQGWAKAHAQSSKQEIPADLRRGIHHAGDGYEFALQTLRDARDGKSAAVVFGDIEAGLFGTSDHHSIAVRLTKAAPNLVVRPRARTRSEVENTIGVPFESDAKFRESFVALSPDAAQARAWLIEPVRSALLAIGPAWLRTHGSVATVTVYGPADPKTLTNLLEAADRIHTEYGGLNEAQAPSPPETPSAVA